MKLLLVVGRWPQQVTTLLLRLFFITQIVMLVFFPLCSATQTSVRPLPEPCSNTSSLHSRQKRFLYYTTDRRLAFPPGTGVAGEFSATLPLQRGMPEGISAETDLGFPFKFKFDDLLWTSDENPYFILPYEAFNTPAARRRKRHLTFGGDRQVFYQMVEDYLSNIGMNGHNCLLRAICEAHELPFYTQGFFGEALRLLLTASLAAELPESMDVYLEAEKMGSSYQDCSKYRLKCKHTMFSSRTSQARNSSEPQGRLLYYTTDRRITFPPKTNGYASLSFFINNFRGAYTGTSLSMSVSTGVGMDFDALYLTSPEHPLAPIDDVVAAARRKRGVPEDLPAVNSAGGDRELMYPAVEEYLAKFGLKGKPCLMRAICEAHEKPMKSYNFISELIMLFLRPSKSFKPEKRLKEYIEAEEQGKLKKDCRPYYKKCSKSFFMEYSRHKTKMDPEVRQYLKQFMKSKPTPQHHDRPR